MEALVLQGVAGKRKEKSLRHATMVTANHGTSVFKQRLEQTGGHRDLVVVEDDDGDVFNGNGAVLDTRVSIRQMNDQLLQLHGEIGGLTEVERFLNHRMICTMWPKRSILSFQQMSLIISPVRARSILFTGENSNLLAMETAILAGTNIHIFSVALTIL